MCVGCAVLKNAFFRQANGGDNVALFEQPRLRPGFGPIEHPERDDDVRVATRLRSAPAMYLRNSASRPSPQPL